MGQTIVGKWHMRARGQTTTEKSHMGPGGGKTGCHARPQPAHSLENGNLLSKVNRTNRMKKFLEGTLN